jgi:predicted TPR repeat methyltransferase
MQRDPAHVFVRTPTAASVSDYRVVLKQAMQAHQADDLDAAERLYKEVLDLHAGQPDALHYLGVLCHQRGRSDEGVSLIGTALKITPRHPDAHNNVGNIHKESGRLSDAEACYRRALACGPDHYNAQSNLAVVLEAQERLDEAFEAYSKLLQQAPRFGHGHYLMGMFLRNHAQNMEHLEQSVQCFRTAYELDNRNLRALEWLGVSLYALHRCDEAAQVYRDWLARDPENPISRHMLAACGGAQAPARADDAYVRHLFDQFAESFDEQLLNNLGYRAPQVLVDALAKVLPLPASALDVLDAGCGTGLCAPLIGPYARHLTGVDLSGGMIEKATLRGGYDALEVAELSAFLHAHPLAFDLVLSADTLIYFGELHDVLTAAHSALRPDGWLGFTLEVKEGDVDGTELTPSGRYQHTRTYVERVVAAAGFANVRIDADVMRKEGGKPVNGWVVLAQRTAQVSPAATASRG